MVLAHVALIVVAFAIVVTLARVAVIVVAFAIAFTTTAIAIGAPQAIGGDIQRSSMSAYRTSSSAIRTLKMIVVQRHGMDGARSGHAGLQPARQLLPMRPTVRSMHARSPSSSLSIPCRPRPITLQLSDGCRDRVRQQPTTPVAAEPKASY